MKKIVFTFIIFAFIANASAQFKVNSLGQVGNGTAKRSKNLIDRFNTLRALDGLQSIEHDTILDNICKILLTDETKIYRKSAGVYDEDSVRLLLCEKGIIDYRYEIKEISDKDTVAVFENFLLANKWNHIRTGYYRTGSRHLLLKTESYVKFCQGLGSTRCVAEPIDIGSDFNPKQESKCYTDTLVYYFKILIPDQYYYQFYEYFPLSSEKGGNIKKEEVQTRQGIAGYYWKEEEYDFGIKSIWPIDKYSVILNKDNQRVAIIQQR